MRLYSTGLASTLAAFLVAIALPLSAQEGRFGSANTSTESPVAPGAWNVTPSLLYGANWDDNVLLKGRGDEPRGDFLNVVNPRVDASIIGRHGQFSGNYDGAFLFYRELDTLNSFDQHGSVAVKRLLSKHLRFTAADTLSASPTTELALLVGVPFVRTGVVSNELHSGIEADLSKRTSISAAYQFEWVRFDLNPAFTESLIGGHSHGGLFSLRHKRSELTTVTVDYNRHYSTVGGPETFDTQNGSVGLERKLSEGARIYGAGGFSRAAANAFGPALTRPHYHAGFSQRLQRGTIDLLYDRSFARSFGFGGTTDTSDLSARLHLPITQKVYTQGTLSWRSSSFLQVRATDLHSRWIEGSLGYLAQPWVRIEGFFGTAYQTADLPGSTYDRTRFGVQVITLKPMRIH
jgi:hypothetical protein